MFFVFVLYSIRQYFKANNLFQSLSKMNTLYLSLVSSCDCLECGVRNWDCKWDKHQYQGRKNTTVGGHACIAWNTVKKGNPYMNETHNYCRAGGKHYQWCYISAEGDKEECEVRKCLECDSGEFMFKIK